MKRTDLIDLLKTQGIHLSKQRGQNFLIDTNQIKALVSKLDIHKGERILEIGTGLGALTEALLQQGAHVLSYEVDKKVFLAVRGRLQDAPNLTLLHEDFLKADFLKYFAEPFQVVANIPYNLASSICLQLWYQCEFIKKITLLVQKEFATRVVAQPPNRMVGVLSVCLQADFECKILRKVSRQSFFPEPKVDSVYLQLIPKQECLPAGKRKDFLAFMKWGFAERRKKLLSRCLKLYPQAKETFLQNHIPLDCRAEQLSLDLWLHLFYTFQGKEDLRITKEEK